jgi:hypothetical protein
MTEPQKNSMIKNETVLVLLVAFLIAPSCNIHFCNTEYEEPENFKIDLEAGITPSEIIFSFTKDSNHLKKDNFILTCYDVCCPASYYNINNSNEMYKKYGPYFEFIAFTISDSAKEKKERMKRDYPDYWNYHYNRYNDVNGLYSSLWNLYYKNELLDLGGHPCTFIIANNSIDTIVLGSLYVDYHFLNVTNHVDSILEANNYFGNKPD